MKKEETRYMLDDIKIPGTTNSIEITCDGVVKAGYDLNDIEVRIDDNTIYISLPDSPNINDNYIKWDTVECSEKNNILNPIEFSQYKTLVDEIEKKGLEKAESEGIYEKAQEHIKTIIKGFYDQYFFTHLSFSTPFRYFDSSGFPRHPQQNFKTRSYLPRDKDPRPAPEARGFLRGNAGFHTGPVLIAKLFLQKYPRA